MKNLFILRHAEARQGNVDFERALTPHGMQQAIQVGRWLYAQNVSLDYVVHSAAVRTTQTTQQVIAQMDPTSMVTESINDIYNASVNDLLHVIEQFPSTAMNILLVGHNPGVSELVAYLCRGERPFLTPCALCHIQLTIDDWLLVGPHTGLLIEQI